MRRYGVAALLIAPDSLLWTTKVAYRGYLTATFVNHNTAATYVGTGMILWFCLAASSGQSMRFSDLRILLMSRSNEEMALKVILRSAAAVVCAFALLLTGSRAGLLCSSIGLVVALTLMVANRWKLPRLYLIAFALVASAITIVWVSKLGRLASQGLVDENRLSVYHSSLQAIWQRPLLGSGAGTFPDLFPVFRSDDLWSWGVWDYAHSTILEIAFEMGIPIAATVAIGAAVSLVILIKAAISASDRTDRRTLSAIAGIATLGYLHSTCRFLPANSGLFRRVRHFAWLRACHGGRETGSSSAETECGSTGHAGSAAAGGAANARPIVPFKSGSCCRNKSRCTRLSVGDAQPDRLRRHRPDFRRLDLVPEPRVGGRLNFEPAVFSDLPGADCRSQVVQHHVSVGRRDDQDEVANSGSGFDHRQPQRP